MEFVSFFNFINSFLIYISIQTNIIIVIFFQVFLRFLLFLKFHKNFIRQTFITKKHSVCLLRKNLEYFSICFQTIFRILFKKTKDENTFQCMLCECMLFEVYF